MAEAYSEQLEELTQQVSGLQTTILRLEEEKRLQDQRKEAAQKDFDLKASVLWKSIEKVKQCFQKKNQDLEKLKKELMDLCKGVIQLKMREVELQVEVKHQKTKVAELQAQKEEAAEHYTAQMEAAKVHSDARKQQNQELMETLEGLEQQAELKAKSGRLVRELQQVVLQLKESERHTSNLTTQLKSEEEQVELTGCQLPEQSKFPVMKSHEDKSQQSPADTSADSLAVSTSDEPPPTPLLQTNSEWLKTPKF